MRRSRNTPMKRRRRNIRNSANAFSSITNHWNIFEEYLWADF